MNHIIEILESSIKDTYLSKSEAKTLQRVISREANSTEAQKRLRNSVFALAEKKMTEDNFSHVLKWLEEVNEVLSKSSDQKSEAYFSPGQECRNIILEQIESAKKYLNVCVFTISDNTISDALIAAHHRNINVRILTDNDKLYDKGSDIKLFAQKGIPVKVDLTDDHMHHKFMIVDNEVLITGSYNWTRSAMEHNHENILLTREPEVIKSYSKEFEQLWKAMAVFKK